MKRNKKTTNELKDSENANDDKTLPTPSSASLCALCVKIDERTIEAFLFTAKNAKGATVSHTKLRNAVWTDQISSDLNSNPPNLGVLGALGGK